jgi:predicted transcriptional regulator
MARKGLKDRIKKTGEINRRNVLADTKKITQKVVSFQTRTFLESISGQPHTDSEPTLKNDPTINQPLTDLHLKIKNETLKNEINIEDPVWNISDKNAIILGYIIKNKENALPRKKLMDYSGIKETTVKRSIQILIKEQFIKRPQRWKNKGNLFYLYDERICNRFMKERWPEIIKTYGAPPKMNRPQTDPDPTLSRPWVEHEPTLTQPWTDPGKPTAQLKIDGEPTCVPTLTRHWTDHEPTMNQPALISSSLYNIKSTTAKIESILNNHPELGYWRQKDLKTKRINEWIKTTNCSLENMIQSLSYCRFDMVENNHEKEKNINNVFNWFYKIIEKYGDYPRPSNYKSHQEKQIEQE